MVLDGVPGLKRGGVFGSLWLACLVPWIGWVAGAPWVPEVGVY